MVHASPLHRGDPERLKSQPNSTGAFRLVEDTVDVKMMEANLDYWRDPPKIKPLIWEFVQDPQTRLDGFLAGQAEVLDRVPLQHLPVLAGRRGRRGKIVHSDRKRQILCASGPFADLGRERQLPPGGELVVRPGAFGREPRDVEMTEAAVAQTQSVVLKPKIVTGDVVAVIDDVFSDTGTGAMYHLSWATSGDPDAACSARQPRLRGDPGEDEGPRPQQEPSVRRGSNQAEPPLLQVRDLHVEFPLPDRAVHAVRGVSFDLHRGKTLGLVGENSSGKSVTAVSIIQLLDALGRVTCGKILFGSIDLARISDRKMAALRGSRMSMIFENPAALLNPRLCGSALLLEESA